VTFSVVVVIHDSARHLAALLAVATDEVLRGRLAAAARRAAARYDWTRSARAMHAVLAGAARR